MKLDDIVRKNYSHAKNIIGIGTSSRQNLWNGVRLGTVLGGSLSLGLMGLEVSRASRGEVIPTLAGTGIGLVSSPITSAATSAAVIGLASTIGCSPPGLAIAAGLAAMYLDVAVMRGASSGVRYLNEAGRKVRHFETGGNYNDTSVARNLRYQSINEMSGAVSSARSYLGREASYLHQ